METFLREVPKGIVREVMPILFERMYEKIRKPPPLSQAWDKGAGPSSRLW